MIKTATVTGILGCKPWDGNNGRLYFHKLELSNGESGEIGKKTENAFKIGDSLTYTSEESQYGLKFKTAQLDGTAAAVGGSAFNGGQRGASRGSGASFCLAYSKDLTVALIPFNPEKTPTEWVNLTVTVADRFLKWMKENEA